MSRYFSKSEYLRVNKSEILKPVKTPIEINKQNLYFSSFSNRVIKEIQSFQSKYVVVVVEPIKIILYLDFFQQ